MMKAIKLKRRGKLRVIVFLLQNNTPVHSAKVTITEAANNAVELQPQTLYIPEKVLSDFFLFPKFISHLCSSYFGNNDDFICAAEEFLKN